MDIPVLHHPPSRVPWRAESAPGHVVWLLDCCLVRQVLPGGVYSTLGTHQDHFEVLSSTQEGFWRLVRSPGRGWARGGSEFWPLLLHRDPTSANAIPKLPACSAGVGKFRTLGCGTCPGQCRCSVVELRPTLYFGHLFFQSGVK